MASRNAARVFVAWIYAGVLLLTSSGARANTAEPAPWDDTVADLVRRADEHSLWQNKMWLRLGHYREGTFGGYESEVDGKAFFLAEDGKTNPAAELRATLKSVFTAPVSPDASKEHPFCRFPARLLWLSKELNFDWSKLPQQPCKDFAEFVGRMQPESLTLVFSSYYLNNPSSAFGHTFLRINKAKQGDEPRQALLDYAIDFSATVDTNNAVVYAAKGLLGMFPGVYRRIQYFYKVREYNDFESRDIWEYELSLTPPEVLMVSAHIWELGSTYFDYYYLDENCSYHILGAIEVVRPDIELLSHVNWPALPVDTLRALYRNDGLVRSVHYRPSARTLFQERLGRLDSAEVDWVAELMGDPKTPFPKEMSEEQQVRILDASLDVADSMFAKELAKERDERDRDSSELQQTLLERRARILVQSEEFSIEPPLRLTPHRVHPSRRLRLGSGWGPQRGAYHQLGFRLALHDLADPARGFPESAQIEFMPTTLRYFAEAPQLWLEELDLVRIFSLSPWNRFELPMSWTVRAGWERLYDAGCAGCLATTGEVGGGLTLSAFQDGLSWSLLAMTEVAALAPIRGGIADLPLRGAVGGHSVLRVRFTDDLVLLLQGRYSWLPMQTPQTTHRASGVLRYQYVDDFAFEVDGALESGERRVGASSLLYF